jgi:type VI protein secretion system component Hcp
MKSAIRGVVSLLVVIAIAMVPTAASAADQIFMLVPGIPGSSQVSGRTGWIDVLAFSGATTAPGTSTKTALPGQPPPLPCQISVSKQLDIAGPRLWAATVTGQTFATIDIQVVKVGAIPVVIYDILLTNAQITSISDSGSSEFPTENLSFKATTVSLSFAQQNADGSAGTPVTSSFKCD